MRLFVLGAGTEHCLVAYIGFEAAALEQELLVLKGTQLVKQLRGKQASVLL